MERGAELTYGFCCWGSRWFFGSSLRYRSCCPPSFTPHCSLWRCSSARPSPPLLVDRKLALPIRSWFVHLPIIALVLLSLSPLHPVVTPKLLLSSPQCAFALMVTRSPQHASREAADAIAWRCLSLLSRHRSMSGAVEPALLGSAILISRCR